MGINRGRSGMTSRQTTPRHAALGRARPVRLAMALCATCFGAGACSLAPVYQAPAMVETLANATAYAADVALIAPYPALADAPWWETIGGRELSALVNELAVNNLDLAAARQRIDQARALTRQATAARLPNAALSLDGGAARTQNFRGETQWDEVYALGLSSSWNVDVFGGLRGAEIAARLRAEVSTLSEHALNQLLIAELTRSYVNAWALTQQSAIAEQSAASFAETVAITEARYEAGSAQISALDVQIARQNRASAAAAIPELRALLGVQEQAIDVLLARRLGATELALSPAPNAADLRPLDPGTPADVLRRRPDVAAAELNYRAALADVGAARAQRLPSLTLTGSMSRQTNDASDLFDADAMIANLTAGILAPLFQGGRLKAQVEAAEAAAQELASTYALTALSAVADVEGALLFERAYEEQRALRQVSLEAAERSNQIARERYASGQVSILTVLETQRALNTARQDLILAEQARLEARIDLYLALGGDWRADGLPDEDKPS